MAQIIAGAQQGIRSRPMAGEDDFWRMRGLLIDTTPITPIGFNWDMRRLDGKRFYEANLADNRLQRRPIQLWETSAGRLAGFVLSEGPDDAHLNVHPDFRHLEAEMIDWAVARLAAQQDGGGQRLEIYAYEYDALRQRLLAERGFAKTEHWGMIRHMRLGEQPLAQPQVAEGYTLRALIEQPFLLLA